jgi:hypothetical protein
MEREMTPSDEHEAIGLESKAIIIGSTIAEELPRQTINFWRDLAKRRNRVISDEALLRLQIEDIIFAIHSLDRLIFLDLGEQKRNFFIDALYQQIRKKLSRKYSSVQEARFFTERFDDTYNNRQIEYSPFTLQPPTEEKGFAGNLFWEYSKRALITSGITNPIMMITVSLHAFGIFESMQALLKEIVYSR